jgi:2-polyprenyl-6-methoxyphenol hydroxylase-like FAD-dependent oxidoreductase
VTDYDVLVVGYGPTGMVAAALLGRRGHRVGVIERHAGLYNLPRAATFDDDTMRLFQKLGIAESVSQGTRTQETYDWVNADGEVLIRNEFGRVGRSGWPEFSMMFQPDVERELDALCRRIPAIDILQGRTLTGVAQVDGAVEAAVRSSDGQIATVTASYLIGCDGGNSTVRRGLGVEMDDYGFAEPWLVCDFQLKREVSLPMAQQYGDPDQPTSIVSIGLRHHRFSFMLDADLPAAEEVRVEDVWRRVSRWIGHDDAELIRVAPYMFRSTVAQTWRRGRVLLAGDAAHEMPPFLGQGMCSGIRDAHNLAWKLDLILAGNGDDGLLGTYAEERSAHVRVIVEKAVALGRVQTVRDKDAARRRDQEMMRRRDSGEQPEGFRFPGYASGFLAPASTPDLARGQLLPQAMVTLTTGEERRFDDVAGGGWVLLLRNGDWAREIAPGDLIAWRSLGAELVVLGSAGDDRADGRVVVDSQGTYGDWFDRQHCGAAIVRPDWYVYGSAASSAALRRLLTSQLQALRPSSFV